MTTKAALWNGVLLITGGLTSLAHASEPHPKETAAIQHAQAAHVALQGKDFGKAISELEQAVKLVPNSAEYHLKLSNAYIASKRLQPAWLSLRAAAKLQPSNAETADQFSRFWNMFDKVGTFNVGKPIESVVDLLGKPDQRVQIADRDRLVYGFYSVDAKNGRVYELLDLRGLKMQHMVPTEIVAVNLDDRGWRIDYRVNNQLSSMTEFVLPDEKIQNWSELVSVQRLHGQATTGLSLQQVVEGMMNTLAKSNRDRQYRILENDANSILFEWKTGGSKNSVAQHELVRMFYGPRDMHRLAYVKKCNQLEESNRESWLNILRSANLKSLPSAKKTIQQAAETNSPESSVPHSPVTREFVWKLGGRLSGAAMIHSAGVSEEKARATFTQAEEMAEQLGVVLAPLPELVGDTIQDSLACSTYLLKEVGPKLHNSLTTKAGNSHAALLEVAVKSNLLYLLYAPNDSTGKAIGEVLKDRAKEARLPESLFQPLLSNIERGAERKVIVYNVAKLHTDVRLLLEKQAKTRTDANTSVKGNSKLTSITMKAVK